MLTMKLTIPASVVEFVSGHTSYPDNLSVATPAVMVASCIHHLTTVSQYELKGFHVCANIYLFSRTCKIVQIESFCVNVAAQYDLFV